MFGEYTRPGNVRELRNGSALSAIEDTRNIQFFDSVAAAKAA